MDGLTLVVLLVLTWTAVTGRDEYGRWPPEPKIPPLQIIEPDYTNWSGLPWGVEVPSY
jgi:hypothetical protein